MTFEPRYLTEGNHLRAVMVASMSPVALGVAATSPSYDGRATSEKMRPVLARDVRVRAPVDAWMDRAY